MTPVMLSGLGEMAPGRNQGGVSSKCSGYYKPEDMRSMDQVTRGVFMEWWLIHYVIDTWSHLEG